MREQSNMKKQGIIEEIFKRAFKNFPRRFVAQRGINDTFQVDLAEMQQYSDENQNYRYILLAIDIFSKKAYARAIKTKTSREVSTAMESILMDHGESPKNLHSDMGLEFRGKEFQNLMKRYKINYYNTFTHLKAQICERLIRTIKSKIYKLFFLNGNHVWINYLQSIMDSYNDTIHSTIKTKPNFVTKENERFILDTIYHKKQKISQPKFRVGDHVRVSKYKTIFEKGYTPSWSAEVFRINQVQATSPITYILEDLNGEVIKGAFYQQEIAKTEFHDVYLVEKILKKKGNKILVKWWSFPEPTWIKKSDIYD